MRADGPYTAVRRQALARLVGLLDRGPLSPTYGCLDRAFWHLKLVTDFPSATYQQAVLGLAWAAVDGGRPEIGVSAEQAAEWARAAMRFWQSIQNRDGSFNEWYDQEHGYCPTAFTSFAVAEALLLLRARLPHEDVAVVTAAVARAARWLARRHNPLVENQNIAALNALDHAWRLTGDDVFRAAAEEKLEAVLAAQDPEGWFPEYGGADLGYSLLAVDLLAHYWGRTRDTRVAAALDRLVEFVAWFVQPDGSVADGGSRATQHALPYGLELLAHRGHAVAARALAGLHAGLAAERALTPARVDDRYFAYFYVNSYLGAARACSGGHPGWEGTTGDRIFPRAGLGTWSRATNRVVVATKRGGLVRVFRGARLVFADAGWEVRLGTGAHGWSSGFEPARDVTVDAADELVEVRTSGPFHRTTAPQRLVLPFRLAGAFLLRSGAAADRVHSWLTRREVATPRPLPVRLERTIRIEAPGVTVTDRITVDPGVTVAGLSPVEEGRVAHSPSAGFYDGTSAGRAVLDSAKVVETLRRNREVTVQTVVPAGPGMPETTWR